ncbi:UDP-N-acetylmuramate--L-alanine ligase [Candidatus Thermokryptus mobilis]|uniref:UDP-N-acetylmuramate--L-alanine ligase n=1 Tax=Candidatus Thermokryptus mobilis TaxID=1643428 RepID=A0A0S4MW16_9BACT|nr:UDP-N-acetylmuramate--L-alanine ligase [Candidatus Thermokryptus mobilis]CUU03207.1 UDP-N-acetylmuramate--L-alanine ligase [Candidatus Thermokryptus mobilis]
MFRSVKKIHFIGIGGIGMSGIAEILLDQGFGVTGSDKQLSEITERLEKLGAKIYEGHSPEHIEPDVDVVVYSSAIKMDNPEVQEAIRRKIPLIRRAEMLAELMRLKYGIGIAGTHGKTTTTSMVGLILIEGGFDPTVIVGGVLRDLGGTNARLGHGNFIVVEADEFDRSFLQLTPTIAVITTLEPEHLDCYGSVEELKNAFIDFANKVPFYGFVVLCLDEPMIQDIIPKIKKKIVTYGLNAQADVQAIDPEFSGRKASYTLIYKGKDYGRINLQVPGIHNIKNSLAGIAVGMELGIEFEKIKKAVERFRGVYRRFEIRAEVNGIIVVDDYAHHPTEIRAVLQAAKDGWKRRVVAVFQPHLYSRTKDFYLDFGRSFFNADVCVLTDVYPAREEPIEGVSGKLIADAARDFGHKDVHYVPNKMKLADYVLGLVKSGDMVIFMGAGDITKICGEFIKKLESLRND